jgi:hypothetical protein
VGQLSPHSEASQFGMSTIQISRGPAALPPDLEFRFRMAFGREMNLEERKFFGLAEEELDKQETDIDQMLIAA